MIASKTGEEVKKRSAFTLIELLVVIAIIGLLASVILVALGSARAKTRDARRIADIKQLMTALALYYDANGVYPSSSGGLTPCCGYFNSSDASWDTFQTAMSPFIAKLPTDPKQDASGYPGTNNYTYVYFSSNTSVYCFGQTYLIAYRLEKAFGPDPGVTVCSTLSQMGGAGPNTQNKTVGVSK